MLCLIDISLHCIKDRYSDVEVQSIDTDVLILLLAYGAMELELSSDPVFNVHFTGDIESNMVQCCVTYAFMHLLVATQYQALMGKVNVPFLIPG